MATVNKQVAVTMQELLVSSLAKEEARIGGKNGKIIKRIGYCLLVLAFLGIVGCGNWKAKKVHQEIKIGMSVSEVINPRKKFAKRDLIAEAEFM